MATVHDRYTISDAICGQVDTATSLKKASALAQGHAAEHSAEPGNVVSVVTVYDRMARCDCQDSWEFACANAQSDFKT